MKNVTGNTWICPNLSPRSPAAYFIIPQTACVCLCTCAVHVVYVIYPVYLRRKKHEFAARAKPALTFTLSIARARFEVRVFAANAKIGLRNNITSTYSFSTCGSCDDAGTHLYRTVIVVITFARARAGKKNNKTNDDLDDIVTGC